MACGAPPPVSSNTTTTTATTTSSTMVEVVGPPLGDPGPPPAAGTPEAEVLALVNDYRKRAGVPPVVYDNTLSQGCHEHANYMVIHRGTHAMYHLNAHHQNPKLEGATQAGADCGGHADLSHSVENIPDAVHGWMGSLYHRQPVIAPYNGRIALGYARVPGGNYAVALRFVLSPYDSRLYPIAVSGRWQHRRASRLSQRGAESVAPGAVRGAPDQPGGASQRSDDRCHGDSRRRRGQTRRLLPVDTRAAGHRIRAAQFRNCRRDSPKAASRRDATHRAISATWKGEAKTWTSSWTTMPRVTVDATDEVALRAALGRPALVRGTVKHASDVSGVINLTLYENPGSKGVAKVTVMVPESHVKQMAYQLKGKVVEVEATPMIRLGSIQLDASLNGPGVWRFVG